jgi:NTP pyrophosphatase (non-canonical NTP hydrolase)
MPSDSDTTINELRRAVGRFVADRSWERYHSPKNLAMSIAIEAGELMELFQWTGREEVPKQRIENQSKAASELADVLIYCLAFANCEDIDISEAVSAKFDLNAARYPIGSELY